MSGGPRAETGKTLLTTAERRRRAWEMRLDGETLEQIGNKLGITKQAVHNLLKRALADSNKLNLEAAAELRRIEHARLEQRYQRVNALIEENTRSPDAVSKLDARLDAIGAAIRKLWGLDAPTLVDERSDRTVRFVWENALEYSDTDEETAQ